MEQKYICACGLTCCDCLFYKKEIYDTARKLKQLISESQIDLFLSMMSKPEVNAAVAVHLDEDKKQFYANFKVFSQMPDFMAVLEGLIHIQCTTTCREAGGCSMCGTTKECAAIKCIKEKHLQGCWECLENESCSKLNFQRMSYGKTIDDNFKLINEQGLAAVPSRAGDYYEWQRRNKANKD